MQNFLVPAILIALSAAFPLQAANWTVDAAHSNVQFAVTHMMVSTVRGFFDRFAATVTSPDSNPTDLSIMATIEAASVDTREPKRDSHLRSADFFDVEKFPTITFQSTKTKSVAPGNLKVTGNLTMHGVTKEIVLDVKGFDTVIKDMRGTQRTSAVATATIHRSDFDLNWNQTLDSGGVLVSDAVQILLEMEFTREQASQNIPLLPDSVRVHRGA